MGKIGGVEVTKYLYRYSLESNNPTNNDDGNTWEDESRCFDVVALHIAKENAYAWDLFEEPEREVMYVWRDGDFENRLRFLAKFEVIQRLDVIELEEDVRSGRFLKPIYSPFKSPLTPLYKRGDKLDEVG